MPFGSGRKKGSEWTEVSEIEGDTLSSVRSLFAEDQCKNREGKKPFGEM
jgi:hypothetical protein